MDKKTEDLKCLFTTVKEQIEPIEAQITGEIPSWVQGAFLRLCPGKFEVGEDKFLHWFDGHTLIKRFDIHDGKVTFRSKFTNTDTYNADMKANRITITQFGTAATPDPCKNIFQRVLSWFTDTPPKNDTTNVAFTSVGDAIYSVSEHNFIHRIDLETLDTVQKVDLNELVSVNMATAHPHIHNGITFNLGNNFKTGHIHIIKMDPAGKSDPLESAEIIGLFPVGRLKAPYVHSFFMTERYIILHESPYSLNVLGLKFLTNLGWSPSDSFGWDHSKKFSYFHIWDRETGKRLETKYVTKPCMNFHVMNSYEVDNHLVLDMPVTYDKTFGYHHFTYDNIMKGSATHITKSLPNRFVIPLGDDENMAIDKNLVTMENSTATAILKDDGNVHLTPEALYDQELEDIGGFEFPQINYDNFHGKPYRYSYGFAFNTKTHNLMDKLVKLDVVDKTFKIWEEEECYPSEPVFVAQPGVENEDQGVILSLVFSSNPDKFTFLLVLDAESFTELGRANMPYMVPMGLHGKFYPMETQ